MPNARSPNSAKRLQVDLPTLFLITLSLAVGSAVGANSPADAEAGTEWFHALLATASTLAAAALFRDARALGRERHGATSEQKSSYVGLAWWQGALALVLVTCTSMRFLINRGYFKPPESVGLNFYGDAFTQYVWWLALGIALNERLRSISPPSKIRLPLVITLPVTLLTTLAAISIGLYVIWELLTVWVLVHIACCGVDAGEPSVLWRYPITSRSSEVRLASMGLAAVAAALAAAGFLSLAFYLARRGRGYRLALASGVLLMAYVGSYTYWFLRLELPRISPDLAAAGVCSTWFEILGGVALIVLATTYMAYRVAATPSRESQTTSLSKLDPWATWFERLGEDVLEALKQTYLEYRAAWSPRGTAHTSHAVPRKLEILLLALMALAAAAISLTQQLALMQKYSTSLGEALGYMLMTPAACFMLAMAVISLQLLRAAWRPIGEVAVARPTIDGRLFALSAVVIAAWALIAVPTLFAGVFSYWLGPWYY